MISDDRPQSTKLRDRLLRTGMLQRGADDLALHAHEEMAGPPLETLVDGQWIDNELGRCFVTERAYPLRHVHGCNSLTSALHIPVDTWSPFVWPPSSRIDLAQALFIDTETTGLARSTGTYAFMVGVGFFEAEQFVIRQFFMPNYGDEEALLQLLDQDLTRTKGLVSFNGRTFDWPILKTRFVLARRPLTTPEPPHLDLLTLSRRLWKRTLPSCSLGSLEKEVLGITRSSDDVPGYEIPRIYQDYVQYGYTHRLVSVFYHNVIDVLSMVALASQMGRLILSDGQPLDDTQCGSLSLGILYERMEQPERALHAYELASQDARYPDGAHEAVKRQALLLKRLGRIEEALDLWHRNLDGTSPYPYIELAKHYEHQKKDFAKARQLTLAAMAIENGLRMAGQSINHEHIGAELAHRLARLERRLKRADPNESWKC